ncbi:ABC transporter ATP-binding protein [Haladaptatus sp. DJG-WS-42]|uniref:ABC transporter ATP-binding protein n=1 Tax=Haladaptatus sp. DJG-WS-42 TaxID=3120516 RepID=UPI0030D001D9
MSNSDFAPRNISVDEPLDEPSDRAVLTLNDVGKSFGSERVLDYLSFSVREGEILTLLGPSGCGKTTTLRLIAGLARPDDGTIRLNDTVVAGNGGFLEPEERGIGVVFQEFALFPHLTAAENIAFGLKDMPKAAREKRVEELLHLVGLTTHRESTPDQLSGGQQQRVALARSLAPEPEILLLDEPFSNLDVDLRVEMREEVRRIIKEAGVTAISVTHDQEEAFSISDRVAVMNDGKLEQIGSPEQVFQHPESRFVAGFLGHASFLSGTVSGDSVETGIGTIPRDQIHGLVTEYDETEIDVLVRPDDLVARPASESQAGGHIVYRRYLGPTVLYRVELETGDVLECMHNHDARVSLGMPVTVSLAADHDLAWFPPDSRWRVDSPADD